MNVRPSMAPLFGLVIVMVMRTGTPGSTICSANDFVIAGAERRSTVNVAEAGAALVLPMEMTAPAGSVFVYAPLMEEVTDTVTLQDEFAATVAFGTAIVLAPAVASMTAPLQVVDGAVAALTTLES